MPSTKFTYKGQEFEINLLGQLRLAYPMQLTLADFNNIFALEDVKNNVTELHLNNFYSLKQIPANLFKLTNLRILQIIKCNISVLPKSISKLQNLQDLYLQDNQLKELPDSLANIRGLKLLYLEKNPLEATKNNIDTLHSIYNNGSSPKPIIRVDDGFGGLPLVTDRVYQSGITKGNPFKKNMLLQSDFDILLSPPPPTPTPTPTKEKTPKKLSRSSSNRSNRTKRSRSSSNRSNGTQRSRSS
jgi:Leucine-rich repeat (LRR) protein